MVKCFVWSTCTYFKCVNCVFLIESVSTLHWQTATQQPVWLRASSWGRIQFLCGMLYHQFPDWCHLPTQSSLQGTLQPDPIQCKSFGWMNYMCVCMCVCVFVCGCGCLWLWMCEGLYDLVYECVFVCVHWWELGWIMSFTCLYCLYQSINQKLYSPFRKIALGFTNT